jgi:tetratricopeptide (TPR) repeat protein
MGNFDLGEQDSDTALLIAPEDWILPYELKGMGNLVEMNPVDGIKNYTKVIEKRPDWFSYNMRGYFYFVAKEYELARIDIEKSIELGPEAEYPYMWATLIALRQGRMEDVSELQTSLLSEQPDPAFVERFMTALYGEKHAIFLGNSMAAMGHLSLGQYNIVIQNTDNVLSVVPAYPEMYLVKGLSYCNLNNFATAEAAYSQGLAIDPSFTVLYLLRAEVRSKLGDMVGAGEDLVVVQQSDLAENLNSYLVAAESGEFSCKQLITTK